MKSIFASPRHSSAPPMKASGGQKTFFSKSDDGARTPFFAQSGSGHAVQAKFIVAQTGDEYEKEAEAVADQVVGGGGQAGMSIQRSMPSGAGGGIAAGAELLAGIRGAQGKGSPLPDATRSEMEDTLGSDLGRVSIHADESAVQMNRELGAQAFTHGQDIYFDSGKYHPDSTEGKRLLVHELTHVVQQAGGHGVLQTKTILPTKQELLEGYHRNKALTYARAGSYAMTGKSNFEHAARGGKELIAELRGEAPGKRVRVQSSLGGKFLRMYLDHQLDSDALQEAAIEIEREPEFKKLEVQINKDTALLGKRLLNEDAETLLKKRVEQHLQKRLKHGGIAFKHEANTIIGGVSGAEARQVRIIRTNTENGTQIDYEIDVVFKDRYDFENKRSGAYDKYRKDLARLLKRGDYSKFWELFEAEALGKGKTSLDSAAIFASFMYALEKKGWTPGPLSWETTTVIKGSTLIPLPPRKLVTPERRLLP